jgi:hypothetical protein
MNSLLLLMGLLLVAYLGSFLVGGERSVRGIGLPSSVEWVVLGFIVGPHALGLVASSVVESVKPFLFIGIGWLALIGGANYAETPFGPVPRARVAGALGWATFAAGVTAAAIYFAIPWFVDGVGEQDRRLLAITLGAASTETTRHVMRWVQERYGATGPVFRLLTDIADAEDVIPVALIAVVFALTQPKDAVLGPAAALGATLGVGVVLGLVCALLLGAEFRLRESWGVLLGTSILAIGVAAQVGLSVIAVLFILGMTIAVASKHAGEIREMLLSTERSALLPILIVCGIRAEAAKLGPTLALAAIVIVIRVVVKYMLGGVIGRVEPAARPAGGLVGVGMMSSGALTMLLGLSVNLRFPGFVGETALVAAALLNVVGELFGPPALRSALRRVGEIQAIPEAPRSSGALDDEPEDRPSERELPWNEEEEQP